MKEALYYIKQKNKAVKCLLCPHECEIKQGNSGFCRVRENVDGILYTNTYNNISSIAIDPIEKKPLRRYRSYTKILSVGTWGCNLRCEFCQNYHISQMKPELKQLTCDELLELSTVHKESIGIAFTYNEPTIWYEYILDAAQKNDKDTVLVTNGFINREPLLKLLPYIDAMNIDLKSMNADFYKKICRGSLEAVQEMIKTAYQKTHIELTFLAIPELNDSIDEMERITRWIADIDKKISLHIIPFRPIYRMRDRACQTRRKIESLKLVASKKLDFVY